MGAGRPELLAHRRRRRLGAGHVLGPVQHHQRPLAHDLQPPGRADRGGRRGHDVGLERAPEERLRAHQRGYEIVGLVAAVEGEVDAFVGGTGGAQVDQAPAHCHHIGVDGVIPPGQPQSFGLLGHEDLVQGGVGLPEHQGRARFDDAGLLPGDVLTGGPQQLGVVQGDVGHDGHCPVDDIGGVPAPAHAHFDHGGVHGTVGEIPESGGRHELEPAGPQALAQQRLERGQFAQDFGQVVVAYGLEVDHDALVDLFQVRADEGADGEPFENEQLGHGPGRGRFAVGARHVHGRLFVLGVVHQVDQGAYPFGPGGTQALVSEDAFKVLVAVEPRQSVAEVHLSASRVIS